MKNVATKSDPALPSAAQDATQIEKLMAEINTISARRNSTGIWLPIKQATAFAGGYHHETVRLWAERGEIGSRRTGGKIEIDVTAIIARVAKRLP